jgi:hypothetical protein
MYKAQVKNKYLLSSFGVNYTTIDWIGKKMIRHLNPCETHQTRMGYVNPQTLDRVRILVRELDV